MDKFFNPKSIAIIGASRNPTKVGYVTVKNLKEGKYKGKIYPINPNTKSILNLKAYPSVLSVKGIIEVALIAVPAKLTLKVIEECGKKSIKRVIIVTAGFSEIGNETLERQIVKTIKKYKMRLLGPNCLGILDVHHNVDTLFLPASRLVRPKKGKISFITQSGATGSTVLDLMAVENYGFSKFISYGNASDINETDLIKYLGDDPLTKVICMYTESIREGRKFLEVAKNVTKKKPLIVLKGGITEAGAKATLSHTASLAGTNEIYTGAFKQANVIQASNLEDLFNYAKIIEKATKPKGRNVQIITNGGGFGILASDYLSMDGFTLPSLSKKTASVLKKAFPSTYTVSNPIDLTGSANSNDYRKAIQACLVDKNIDVLLIILLYQTPEVDVSIVDSIIKFNNQKKKPIILISMGGAFTQKYKHILEAKGVPCFTYPHNAARSIKVLCDYYLK